MALVSQMRGTPPTYVVGTRTAPTAGLKSPFPSRPRVTSGLAVGLALGSFLRENSPLIPSRENKCIYYVVSVVVIIILQSLCS